MSLTRRLFMKFAGAAPVAASVAAPAALESLYPNNSVQSGMLNASLTLDAQSAPVTNYSHKNAKLTEAARMLARFSSPTPATRDDRMGVGVLETDLAANRSMSLATKVRIQAERNVAHRAEQERGYWQNRLDELKELVDP